MNALALILYVFAFVCFVLAAVPVAEPHRGRLVPAGLAFWVFVSVLAAGKMLTQ